MGRLQKLLGIGVVALGLTGLAGKADAGTIQLWNYNSNGINYGSILTKNIPEATEGYGYGDGSFISSPNANALEIYTMVEGNKLKVDARPIDTSGWDFNLGVKGTVNCDNSLKFKVTDTTDLTGKGLTAYDTTNPSQKYVISKNLGVITTIPLANLVNQSTGEYAHWRLDVAPSYMKVDLLKSNDNGVTWVAPATGTSSTKIIYSSDANNRTGSMDSFDTAVGWTTADPFNSTSPGEYGVYTRGAAFGYDKTTNTSTNDRLKQEGKLLGGTENILLEGYRNSSTTDPIYTENEKYKLVFSTNDPEFFKTFNIIQDEPYDFWADPRYDSRKINPSPLNPGEKVLSNPETHQDAPYTTLESIIDSTTGTGEMTFTAQGCLMGDGSSEIDALIGPTFAFDIFPSGGSAYVYDGNSFYIEGGYQIWHTTTPEPSTLALLGAGATLAGLGLGARGIARYIRRKEDGKDEYEIGQAA